MWKYENVDEGAYCEYGDHVYHEDDIIVPIDQWSEQLACPICGHVDAKVYRSDYYYEVGFYLLSIADDDFTWPEYSLKLPAYQVE